MKASTRRLGIWRWLSSCVKHARTGGPSYVVFGTPGTERGAGRILEVCAERRLTRVHFHCIVGTLRKAEDNMYTRRLG